MTDDIDDFQTVREIRNQSPDDIAQFRAMEAVFQAATGSLNQKIDAFPAFASRQAIARFLAKYQLFRKILRVNGWIIECGVLHGAGLMTFAKLSSIFEPANYTREIIGFDTFEGFPSLHEVDRSGSSSHLAVGALRGSTRKEVEDLIGLYDTNRPLRHIPKVKLVEGDLAATAQRYVTDNPHLVVALLYLDVDLYEPTKAALEAFSPLIPKGGIIAFDELNAKMFPGETIAANEVIGISRMRLQRFEFDPFISFAVIE